MLHFEHWLRLQKDAAGRSDESCYQSYFSIPVWYVLLDNQSVVDVFSNTPLLANILKFGRTLHLSYNSSTLTITLVGYLEGCGTVCFHTNGIADILSLF